MDHFESVNQNIASQNIQISAYTSLPSNIQQPKTRCPHCCYHRSLTSYPCATPTHHASCTCNGNVCTRTCFSPLQSHYNQSPPTGCGCPTPVVVRQHPSSSHQLQESNGCPCCRRQQSAAALVDHHSHQQISRIHLTTENVTYPTPHYATAYASLPGLHHSWEPTTGYRETEYNIHMGVSNGSSIPEYHSHVHHHINHHINNENECTDRNQSYRDQAWQSYTSRHYRRHSNRLSSHPYPSVIHYPVGYHYPALSRSLIPASYLFPPRHLIPASFEVIGELENEPLTDEDWQEMEARNTEPKGLTKYEIQRLPSYFVTKNTMKDFTENERCVICMCEFDVENSLRILPCAHEFHCECVDKWLETNPTCPICRATVEVT